MRILFVRGRHTGYSIIPLVAVVREMPGVVASVGSLDRLASSGADDEAGTPSVCAFSFNSIDYPGEIAMAKPLMERLRARGCLIIAGGPHPTACPDEVLADGFDIVVRGAGEEAIRYVAGEVAAGRRPPQVLSMPARDIDSYPPYPPDGWYKPIEITRGCPHACRFCQASFLFPAQPQHRSIGRICEALGQAFRRGISDFRFITPNAFGYGSPTACPDLGRLSGLLQGIRRIIGRDGRVFFGTFPSEVRPESVTDDCLRLLRETADNTRITIGAQTMSARLLERCHRGHGPDDVHAAVERILAHGYGVDIDLMFGLPGEQPDDVAETLAFIERYRGKGDVRHHVHYFMPLPGTPWSHERPVPLPDGVLRHLERLVGSGVVWGTWVRQQARASAMATGRAHERDCKNAGAVLE